MSGVLGGVLEEKFADDSVEHALEVSTGVGGVGETNVSVDAGQGLVEVGVVAAR